MNDLSLNIGDEIINLKIMDDLLYEQVKTKYVNFLTDGTPDLKIIISSKKQRYEPPNYIKLNNKPNIEMPITGRVLIYNDISDNPKYELKDDVAFLSSFKISGKFDVKSGFGEFILKYWFECLDGVQTILMTCLSSYLLEKGCFLLHSSGIEINGKGFVFTSHSTGGKTTILDQIKKGKMLSDEFNIIKPTKNKVFVFSTPFGGDKTALNLKIELNRIFVLEKNFKTFIHDLEITDSTITLLSNEYVCMRLSNQSKRNVLWKLLNNISEVLERIPCSRLYFNLSDEVMDYLS